MITSIPFQFGKPPFGAVRRSALRFVVLSCLTFLVALTSADAQTTDGLLLWLKADNGVTTTDGVTVTGWADSTSNLNDATQTQEGLYPSFVPDAVNGHPAVRFDGVDDYLEIANSASLQPGTGDWTVFVVAKRLSGSQGDFPQIIGSRPWTAGLDKGWAVAYSADGHLGSHFADGSSGHDVPAVGSSTVLSGSAFQLWQVEENRAAGTTSFYVNGDLDRLLVTSMPLGTIDQADPVRIGREVGGSNSRRANMDLAEVLIYNRVLNRAERDAVAGYLSTKYGLGFSPNQPPTVALISPVEGATFDTAASFNLSATAADPDGAIRSVEFFVGSSRIGIASQPPFRVPIRVLTPGSLTITAVVTDTRGERVVSTPVNIKVTGAGGASLEVKENLRLWLAADNGALADGDGLVTDWLDQSDQVNDAAQHDPALAPQYIEGAVNGKPVLRFDGVDDYLEIANAVSLQPMDGDWTVFVVGQRRAGSQGDFPQIIGSRPWVAGLDKGWAVAFDGGGLVASHFADGSTGHDVPAVRSASALSLDAPQVWQVEENRTSASTTFYQAGGVDQVVAAQAPVGSIDQAEPVRIGREIGGANNRRASMDLAEIVVYGRVLSTAERENVTAYLSLKYGLPLAASLNVSPTVALISPIQGDQYVVPTNLTLVATAADADGSVAGVQFYRGTTLIGTVTTTPYSLSVSNATAGTITYTAVAIDNLGASTRSASVTITNVTLNPPVAAPIDLARGLISVVDYEDTFTVGSATRADGLYNNNGTGGYEVETANNNPTVTWTPFSNFSFNSGGTSTCCGYPGNGVNAGAGDGVAQSGGGDFSILYGLRDSYVVSVDAILPPDRLDISSMPAAGAGLATPNSLSVFFRKSPGSIGVFNGVKETSSGAQTDVTDSDWHNYAVHFDRSNHRLGIFVDGLLKTNLDLITFAGGDYAEYSNAAVGLGGTFVFWADNFKVGAAGRLLRSLDFSDSFSVGTGSRPDGLYNNNTGGGYAVESDPTRTWLPISGFSFNAGGTSTCCGYPGNGSNAGAAGGVAQSGGGDFSIEYGTRTSYLVEVDAILPPDRFEISSMPAAGSGLATAGSLTVFFRKDGVTPGIGLFDGSTESDTGLTTGVTDAGWHRYGVHYDRPNQRLGIYVDRALRAEIDLQIFAGGKYRNYSNAAVGMGGTFVFWADNFQVGPPEVEWTSRLAVSRTGPQTAVTWTGSGLLEEASDLQGPWTPLPAARSPYSIDLQGAKFYRLRR